MGLLNFEHWLLRCPTTWVLYRFISKFWGILPLLDIDHTCSKWAENEYKLKVLCGVLLISFLGIDCYLVQAYGFSFFEHWKFCCPMALLPPYFSSEFWIFFASLSVDYDGGRWAGNKSLSINQRFSLMYYWFIFSVSIAGWFIIWGFHILSTDCWVVQWSGFNLVLEVNFEVSPFSIDYTVVQWAGNKYKLIYWKNHISLRDCVIHT